MEEGTPYWKTPQSQKERPKGVALAPRDSDLKPIPLEEPKDPIESQRWLRWEDRNNTGRPESPHVKSRFK